MAKILVVDNDKRLCTTLVDWFERELYKVDAVYTCKDARDFLKTYQYDVVVLDWNMPDGSGIEVLDEFRKDGGKTPVLMLTGNLNLGDKELGLDTGADDYLTKPFEVRELMARVRALVRRASDFAGTVLKVGDIVLNPLTHEVSKQGTPLKISPTEFALLEFFMRNVNRIYNAETLLNRVWTADQAVGPDAVRTMVSRLRTHIDSDGQESLIESVYGVGYKMRQP